MPKEDIAKFTRAFKEACAELEISNPKDDLRERAHDGLFSDAFEPSKDDMSHEQLKEAIKEIIG